MDVCYRCRHNDICAAIYTLYTRRMWLYGIYIFTHTVISSKAIASLPNYPMKNEWLQTSCKSNFEVWINPWEPRGDSDLRSEPIETSWSRPLIFKIAWWWIFGTDRGGSTEFLDIDICTYKGVLHIWYWRSLRYMSSSNFFICRFVIYFFG